MEIFGLIIYTLVFGSASFLLGPFGMCFAPHAKIRTDNLYHSTCICRSLIHEQIDRA